VSRNGQRRHEPHAHQRDGPIAVAPRASGEKNEQQRQVHEQRNHKREPERTVPKRQAELAQEPGVDH